MAANPLLLKGFTSGWLQKFFNEPFDPLCIMLAMRSKLLLDAIDELGHSYNLLRSIGYGWIDFGEIPGELPGNPEDYYPPGIDEPIIITPPGPGEPGYVPPGPGEPGYTPPMPGEPGYTPPGPGEPGYVPPGPGEPGYTPPGPGEPGYVPPGPGPGEPGFVPPGPGEPGYVPPGGGGPAPGYGGGGLGGPDGSMAPSWGLGYGPADTGGHVGGGGAPPYLNCCLDKDNPSLYVTIYPLSMSMDCGDTQTFMVKQYNPSCPGSHYTWFMLPDAGTLVVSGDYQVDYTAPDGGAECPPAVAILLYCDGVLVDSVTVTFNACPDGASIGHTTHEMGINEEQTLTAVPTIPGCGTPTYNWAITAGGGTLSAATGAAVTYTAPASNAECANNPTITLSCGGVLDTLKIAITAWPGPSQYVTAGHYCCLYTFNGYHYSCHKEFYCRWGYRPGIDQACIPNCGWTDNAYFSNSWDCVQGGPNDTRDPAWITLGCCPPQFL